MDCLVNLNLPFEVTNRNIVNTMEITKFTTTEVTDDHVNLYLPIQKVDEERRIVSGFATLDNLDKHNDVVTAEASRKAFKSFRGNIREMHMPKAVGRMVNFTEKTLRKGDESYNGIYVEVYVSKGAEDTWQKVLDRTLSGFSIGGAINPEGIEKNESGGRIIKDYHLTELSLVDSPANPLANVFSIQKREDGYEFSGFATESTDFEDEEVESVEKADTPEFQELVSEGGSGVSININPSTSTINEETLAERIVKSLEGFFEKTIGGNTMTNKTEETAVEEVEDSQTEEVVEESTDSTAVEKAADVSEVEEVEETSVDADEQTVDVDTIVEKVLERLNESADDHGEVEKADKPVNTEDEAVEESNEDATEAITKAVSEALASVTDKVEELRKTISDLKEETNDRLSGLEDASAVKKSTDTGKTIRKRNAESDFWADSALGGTKTSA